MEFRNIFIANPAKLFIRDSLLVIRQDREITLPIEDISSIMIESAQVVLTARTLTELACGGVTVIVADEKHLPAAQLLPFDQFSRQQKMLIYQIEASKPLKKQLWQKIVCQKIKNQAQCLRLCGRDGAQELAQMASGVQSGDPNNVEATAAAFYFRCLFGEHFTRGEDCLPNAMLNYGYAIVRACIARNLAVHGLEPCLGIHHRNQLNPFNLADDLIEPFRPLVDIYVAKNCPAWEGELTPERKHGLFNLTNYLVLMERKKYRVMNAVEQSTASLSASFRAGQNRLILPELIPLEPYRYD